MNVPRDHVTPVTRECCQRRFSDFGHSAFWTHGLAVSEAGFALGFRRLPAWLSVTHNQADACQRQRYSSHFSMLAMRKLVPMKRLPTKNEKEEAIAPLESNHGVQWSRNAAIPTQAQQIEKSVRRVTTPKPSIPRRTKLEAAVTERQGDRVDLRLCRYWGGV